MPHRPPPAAGERRPREGQDPLSRLHASGRTRLRAAPDATRAAILNPAILARIIPGAERVARAPDGTFTATLGLGVGPFRGRQTVTLRAEEEPGALAITGHATGPFGGGTATGRIDLHPDGTGTRLEWRHDGTVHGPVTLAGPLLRVSAAAFVARVFANLRRAL